MILAINLHAKLQKYFFYLHNNTNKVIVNDYLLVISNDINYYRHPTTNIPQIKNDTFEG